MENSKLTLLLMAGLPGAGKSTLARILERELGWYVINKDRYKEVLLKEGVDEEKAGRAAYELAFDVARALLEEQQRSVILDSAALQRFILDYASFIVHDIAGTQLKVILCVADRDLRNQRLRHRPPQITTIRFDPATNADYLQGFSHLPSDRLTLYTLSTLVDCVTEAKNYLVT